MSSEGLETVTRFSGALSHVTWPRWSAYFILISSFTTLADCRTAGTITGPKASSSSLQR